MADVQFQRMGRDEWIDSSRVGMRSLVEQGRMTQQEYEETCAWQDQESEEDRANTSTWMVSHEREAER